MSTRIREFNILERKRVENFNDEIMEWIWDEIGKLPSANVRDFQQFSTVENKSDGGKSKQKNPEKSPQDILQPSQIARIKRGSSCICLIEYTCHGIPTSTSLTNATMTTCCDSDQLLPHGIIYTDVFSSSNNNEDESHKCIILVDEKTKNDESILLLFKVTDERGGMDEAKFRIDFRDSGPPSSPRGPLEQKPRTDISNTVVLTWKPPLDDGFAPITSYIIERMDQGQNGWSLVSMVDGRSPTTEASLNAQWQRFRVIAENAHGRSKPLEGDLISHKGLISRNIDPRHLTLKIVRMGPDFIDIEWTIYEDPEREQQQGVPSHYSIQKRMDAQDGEKVILKELVTENGTYRDYDVVAGRKLQYCMGRGSTITFSTKMVIFTPALGRNILKIPRTRQRSRRGRSPSIRSRSPPVFEKNVSNAPGKLRPTALFTKALAQLSNKDESGSRGIRSQNAYAQKRALESRSKDDPPSKAAKVCCESKSDPIDNIRSDSSKSKVAKRS